MSAVAIDLNNLSDCVDDAISKYDLMIFAIPNMGEK
ncbi:MAG: hypothetical protein SPLUMA1_SPLUMAMAG1_00095 [uncultured Sulfurimonas sp.]|nr:MAG: hypothetical protein SPLUMA1_SPLUMAMAG1_00095 [uncultured Sulfurimonas sp.]